MAASKISSPSSPKPSDKQQQQQKMPLLSSSSDATCSAAAAAYEQYLRLPEISKLWTSKDFPQWNNESILKPSLQALEITFRLISIALSEPRPYANHREWTRRLESLASHQIELIAALLEDETLAGSGVPVSNLSSSKGLVLTRMNSEDEVWKLPGSDPVVSRTSEESLLPRLAAWDKSEDTASKIFMQIESHMRRCSFTLGLGEPNLSGKPSLEYDLVVRPSALHALKKCPLDYLKNYENHYLFNIHQILESWLFALKELLRKVEKRVEVEDWETAASTCWMVEKAWKLLGEVEDLHLLMDPDDFLQLTNQLEIKKSSSPSSSSEEGGFCSRSSALVEVTKRSKDLRQMVPDILGVEADPYGGPRVQEAAMKLYHGRGRRIENAGKVHLLQGMQVVEAAVKTFYFGYEKVVVAVMGSLESGGESAEEVFMEPPYYPSLDAAKTFLGHVYWQKQKQLTGHQSTTTTRSNRCVDHPNTN